MFSLEATTNGRVSSASSNGQVASARQRPRTRICGRCCCVASVVRPNSKMASRDWGEWRVLHNSSEQSPSVSQSVYLARCVGLSAHRRSDAPINKDTNCNHLPGCNRAVSNSREAQQVRVVLFYRQMISSAGEDEALHRQPSYLVCLWLLSLALLSSRHCLIAIHQRI